MEILKSALPIMSGLLWIAAYLGIIQAMRKDRSIGIPIVAACLNIAWELVYFSGGVALWDRFDAHTHIQTVINGAWLTLDVVIIVWVLKLSSLEYPDIRSKWLPTLILGCILGALAFQGAMALSLDTQLAARLSAFIQNALMSGAFIAMYLRKGPIGQRSSIALCKLFGTLMPTISSGLLSGLKPAILLLGLTCLAMDIVYLLMITGLLSLRRAEGDPHLE